MAKSQNQFMKKQREKQKQRKKDEKQKRKQERQENSTSGNLDDMIAYVDDFGNIIDTPPEEQEANSSAEEKRKP